MNLGRFERWLLDEEALDAEKRAELDKELTQNAELASLRDRLQAVDAVLGSARMSVPATGFAARWRVRLAREQETMARRQAVKLLGALSLIGSGALALAGLLLVSSPAERASSFLKALVSLRAQFEFVWDLLTAVVPGGLGVLVITSSIAAVGMLSMAWITSLYRFAYLERRNGV